MEWLGRLSRAVEPLIDAPPIHAPSLFTGSLRQRLHQWHAIKPLLRTGTYSTTEFIVLVIVDAITSIMN